MSILFLTFADPTTGRHRKAEEDNTSPTPSADGTGFCKNTSKNDYAQEELRQSALKPTPNGGAFRREGLRLTVFSKRPQVRF